MPGRLGKLCLGGALVAVALPGQAQQQGPVIEEIVTIGTRMQGRTATDTAVPVDVVSTEELQTVPAADISNVISKLIPSFDITPQPVADGASHIRPSQMRGLDSDKVLVLVNGKRRHRSALVFLDGFGAHGPDLNPIPAIALNSVEVLRDGASALYGSDAIAGVMNFNLKNASDGGALSVRAGQYAGYDHEGDYQVAANKGFALGDSGFVNVSAEWAKRERADRGTVYNFPIAGSGLLPSQAVNTVMQNAVVDGIPMGTRYGPDALTELDTNDDGVIDTLLRGSDTIPDDPDTRFRDNLQIPEQAWGSIPEEGKKVFINAGFKLNDSMEVYAFGNYMAKESNSSFYYRGPSNAALAPVRLANGSIYNPRDRYPGGFTPRFYGDVEDYSLATGLRGEFGNGIIYDFSGRYGNSNIEYTVKNTLNPSMGPDSPTQFRAGGLQSDEMSINADFAKPIDIGWHSPLNVAVGLEYRDEGYKISKGEPLSYFAGPYAQNDPWNLETTQAEVDASPTDSVTQIGCNIPGLVTVGTLCHSRDPIHNFGGGIGSNGFPGYDPNFTTDYNRKNSSIYLTLESDVTENFFGSVSSRFEDYEDFGSNFSWRTAGRYRLTDGLALRSSVGTGFKAPTAGQLGTVNVSTRVFGQGELGQLGIFPATHPAAVLFGAKELEPEKSFSYTAGVTFEPLDGLSLALDYYYIKLKDRITFSGRFEPDAAQAELLSQMNIPGGESIRAVQYFTNDADTETKGFDLVVDYRLSWMAGVTTFTFRGNWNQNEIVHRPQRPDGNFLVDDVRKFGIEHAPGRRGVFGVNHAWDKLNVDVRVTSYGSSTTGVDNDGDNAPDQFQTFGSLQQVDMALGWRFTDAISATLGGRNVLDKYPDEDTITTCCGQRYSEVTADWFGRFWYLNMNANF